MTASPAGAAASWQFHQLDSDRCYDASTLDANHNGFAEHTWFDLDNDCRWDTHQWNTIGGDNFTEAVTYDMNEAGRWEIWLADTNQRTGYDIAYFDYNGDGYYDRWSYVSPGTASIGASSAYVINFGSRHNSVFGTMLSDMARLHGIVVG